jgi:hypothetical protein
MPGLDRSGPLGAGPGTGRGQGRCRRYAADNVPLGVGRGGEPRGGGRGRCFGGRGLGQRRGVNAGEVALVPSEQAETLKTQLAAAEDEIASLRARLEELENKG